MAGVHHGIEAAAADADAGEAATGTVRGWVGTMRVHEPARPGAWGQEPLFLLRRRNSPLRVWTLSCIISLLHSALYSCTNVWYRWYVGTNVGTLVQYSFGDVK